jgi:hypothetical protein
MTPLEEKLILTAGIRMLPEVTEGVTIMRSHADYRGIRRNREVRRLSQE